MTQHVDIRFLNCLPANGTALKQDGLQIYYVPDDSFQYVFKMFTSIYSNILDFFFKFSNDSCIS